MLAYNVSGIFIYIPEYVDNNTAMRPQKTNPPAHFEVVFMMIPGYSPKKTKHSPSGRRRQRGMDGQTGCEAWEIVMSRTETEKKKTIASNPEPTAETPR